MVAVLYDASLLYYNIYIYIIIYVFITVVYTYVFDVSSSRLLHFPTTPAAVFEVHLTASECIGMQCLCGSLMWALSKIKWWKAKHAMQLVTRYVLEYTKRNQPCSPSACPSGTKTSAFPRPKPRESSAEGGQTEPCPWSQTRPLWSWSGRATKSSIYAWPPQEEEPGLADPRQTDCQLVQGKFLASHFSAWYIPSGELATHEQRPQWSARPGQQGQCEQPTRSATTRPRSEAHAWGWHPPTSNTPPEPKRWSYFRQPSYDKGSQCDACRSSARGAQRRPPPTNAALADLSGAAPQRQRPRSSCSTPLCCKETPDQPHDAFLSGKPCGYPGLRNSTTCLTQRFILRGEVKCEVRGLLNALRLAPASSFGLLGCHDGWIEVRHAGRPEAKDEHTKTKIQASCLSWRHQPGQSGNLAWDPKCQGGIQSLTCLWPKHSFITGPAYLEWTG